MNVDLGALRTLIHWHRAKQFEHKNAAADAMAKSRWHKTMVDRLETMAKEVNQK